MLRLGCALFLFALAVQGGEVSDTNPVAKVIEMLSELEQKIIKEGEASQKVYDEFSEWCEEESKNLGFEIKTGKANVEELKATIENMASKIAAGDASIEEISAKLGTDEADLKAATEIRDKESADFAADEADLIDVVDTLGRAISILEREMAKKGSALVQIENAKNLVDALRVLVDASEITNHDASRLAALVQGQEEDSEDDSALGAPDPAVYKSKSGGIVDVLTDLLDKAQAQLAEARKKETNSKHNYELLKVELDDAIKFGNEELDKAKKGKTEAAETKAVAEGDLAVTSKALAEDEAQLADTHHTCMTKAEEFELEVKSRAEELKALAGAKKVIVSATGGAAAQTYSFSQNSSSLLQVGIESHLTTRTDLANFEAVKYVKDLARRLGSAALAQLANRMSAAAHIGAATGEDPFAKVKGLISEMIERLLKEAEQEASHKAYCDKEMAETEHKKADLEDELEKLNTKIDKSEADSARLKEEVATLQKELADLAKSQAEMDKVRNEEKTAFTANKAEMEEGIEGVQLALKILRDYYASENKDHDAAEGAGGGIIAMLEVVESDFTKGLSEMIAAEDAAQAAYDQGTKENEIAKVSKEQDVKYKTKEFKELDKMVSDLGVDREGAQTELDAVNDYYSKLKDQCVAKVEPYEERKRRREAEIAGLKEALAILEGEAVLLQRERRRATFRGVAKHVA